MQNTQNRHLQSALPPNAMALKVFEFFDNHEIEEVVEHLGKSFADHIGQPHPKGEESAYQPRYISDAAHLNANLLNFLVTLYRFAQTEEVLID